MSKYFEDIHLGEQAELILVMDQTFAHLFQRHAARPTLQFPDWPSRVYQDL